MAELMAASKADQRVASLVGNLVVELAVSSADRSVVHLAGY